MIPLGIVTYPALSGVTAAGVWIAALTLIGIFVRQIVPWKKTEHDSEVQFRDALMRRVENLELQIQRQESRHRAEQALSNHKLRNMTSCFDAMLMMLEMNPERGPEIVAKIKKMRSEQMRAEAREAAIIRAADINFYSDAPDIDGLSLEAAK